MRKRIVRSSVKVVSAKNKELQFYVDKDKCPATKRKTINDLFIA